MTPKRTAGIRPSGTGHFYKLPSFIKFAPTVIFPSSKLSTFDMCRKKRCNKSSYTHTINIKDERNMAKKLRLKIQLPLDKVIFKRNSNYNSIMRDLINGPLSKVTFGDSG